MKPQSLGKQLAIGATFGVVMILIGLIEEPVSLLSFYGLGMLVGGAIGGVVLYMILYRLWPKKSV